MLKYIVAILFLVSCNTATPIQTKIDTVYIKSVDTIIAKSKDCKYDSIKAITDSLRTKLFLVNYKIEKVKFYTRLVDKKPSQMVFYKGWIIRAVE